MPDLPLSPPNPCPVTRSSYSIYLSAHIRSKGTEISLAILPSHPFPLPTRLPFSHNFKTIPHFFPCPELQASSPSLTPSFTSLPSQCVTCSSPSYPRILQIPSLTLSTPKSRSQTFSPSSLPFPFPYIATLLTCDLPPFPFLTSLHTFLPQVTCPSYLYPVILPSC